MSWRTESIALALLGALAGHAPAASEEQAVLAVVVDGRDDATVERFVIRDGTAWAPEARWRALGLRGTPRSADPARVAITDWPGVRATIDRRTQTLHIDQPPDMTRLHRVGAGAAPAATIDSAPGAVLNYDLLLARSEGAGRSDRAALLDGRAFGAWGRFEQGAILADGGNVRRVRLDTTYTRLDPEALRRLRLGDHIAAALSWTRPLRLAGAQWMSDFSLRPDLVTRPLPGLSGSVTLPSTVDLLVDGVRQLSEPVEPGRFEIRQPPVVSGLGEVSVVTRDALGREVVQTLPFYAAPRQLAPGLAEWSLQAGWVRRGYGVESDDYGDAAFVGSWRRGIDERSTVELHAEGGSGTAMAGVGVLHVRPTLGAFDAHLAASRGDGRSGLLAGFGFERISRGLSMGMAWEQADQDFRDIAAAQGEPSRRRSLRLSAGVPVGRSGGAAVAYVASRSAQDGGTATERRLLTASWSFVPWAGVQAYVGAYRDFGSDTVRGASIHLSLPFGTARSAFASVQRNDGDGALALQASQAALAPGDVGWRVQRDQGLAGSMPTRQVAQIDVLAPSARFEAAAEHAGGRGALRLGARGAVVVIDGITALAPPVTGSVALVEVPGAAGVAVYREHRYAGRTDADGRLVLTDLLAWQPNKLSIEPLDLSEDALPAAVVGTLRPAERGGARLRFDMQRSRSALLVLHDADGRPLPVGAQALLIGGRAATVGHDGQAWLNGLTADNELQVRWQGRELCRLRFGLDMVRAGRAGPLRCEA